MRRLFVILTVALCVNHVGYAATLIVPDDYATIQSAIDASKSGDTIIVKAGTYVENIHLAGKTVLLRSDQGSDFTVIDGNRSGSVVSFGPHGKDRSTIEGFTLTNGSGSWYKGYRSGGGILIDGSSPAIINNRINANMAEMGGGILCRGNASDSPIIKNNLICRNRAKYDAGGIWCDHSCPTIANNLISDNSAGCGGSRGGGIWCTYSSTTIANNTITGNSGNSGGGIHCWFGDSATILNNMISGNRSKYGGGIYCAASSSPIMINNILARNTAGIGGGIFTGGISHFPPLIINNTLYCNSAEEKGGGVFCVNGSSPSMKNIILCDNNAPEGSGIFVGVFFFPSALTIEYSALAGGRSSVHVDKNCKIIWGEGMIDVDPLFADPANDDFHLLATSLCIDAGANASTDDAGTDFEGDPRLSGGRIDMGADEFYPHLYVTGEAKPGNAVRVKLVGTPSFDACVMLFIGTAVLVPSMKSKYGDWHLRPPISILELGTVPRNGVISLLGRIPGTHPTPSSIPMQALMDETLTNLCVVEIE